MDEEGRAFTKGHIQFVATASANGLAVIVRETEFVAVRLGV